MAKTRNADRRRHWEEAIERQQASGQSIVEFCAKEGLSPGSFHAWKRRLRRPPREIGWRSAKQALVPVQVVTLPQRRRETYHLCRSTRQDEQPVPRKARDGHLHTDSHPLQQFRHNPQRDPNRHGENPCPQYAGQTPDDRHSDHDGGRQ